jgi:thioredoxin 1
MVREISDESYEGEVVEPGGTVLLLAYAPWCGDCQRILPVFEALSRLPEFQEVCFLQTDMVKNLRTKKALGVERYPTLCLFRKGRQVAEKVAEVPKEEQRAIIENLLRDCASAVY